MGVFYTPWEGTDERRTPGAFLKVELEVADPAELDRLLAEYRREVAGGAVVGGDIVAWLARHGITAELVLIPPDGEVPF